MRNPALMEPSKRYLRRVAKALYISQTLSFDTRRPNIPKGGTLVLQHSVRDVDSCSRRNGCVHDANHIGEGQAAGGCN